MTIISSQAINQDQIKLRWQEPYVSAALNNKTYKTMPRGVYRGFVIEPDGGLNIKVTTGAPTGDSGYQGGNFDAAGVLSWSVAVHENLSGYSATIIMQRGVNSDYPFTLTAGTTFYVALDVVYQLGFPSSGTIKLVDAAELDLDPTLLCLGKIEVPAVGPITALNIIYDDALYPRVLPFANNFKSGFMTALQAQIVEAMAVPNASPAFEVEYVVPVDGAQVITIPGGNTYAINGNDLLVFRNGAKMQRGRDFIEIDRGDGKGEQVNWLATTLKADDRIVFHGQEYAVALTNTLAVQDEGALIAPNVTRMNFVGNGVLVLPDGSGRVRVLIPSSGSTDGSAQKQKLNNTIATIPQATVVTLLGDGTIAPCDPKNPLHRLLGVTSGAIPVGEYGTVVTSGVAVNALFGIGGFSVGDQLWLSADGDGTIVTTPPDPLVAQVWRLGIADCPDLQANATATDIILQIQRMI